MCIQMMNMILQMSINVVLYSICLVDHHHHLTNSPKESLEDLLNI